MAKLDLLAQEVHLVPPDHKGPQVKLGKLVVQAQLDTLVTTVKQAVMAKLDLSVRLGLQDCLVNLAPSVKPV